MDCGLRGSRERNAIPESGPRNQRAKGSRRERPRNRKKRQRETRFLRAQCCHREHSTVSGLMSYSLICAHSLRHFSCIPQLTDFFAFFTQWPPAQRWDLMRSIKKENLSWGAFLYSYKCCSIMRVFFYFLEPQSSWQRMDITIELLGKIGDMFDRWHHRVIISHSKTKKLYLLCKIIHSFKWMIDKRIFDFF